MPNGVRLLSLAALLICTFQSAGAEPSTYEITCRSSTEQSKTVAVIDYTVLTSPKGSTIAGWVFMAPSKNPWRIARAEQDGRQLRFDWFEKPSPAEVTRHAIVISPDQALYYNFGTTETETKPTFRLDCSEPSLLGNP